jgi:hypothetical protein
MHCTSSGMPGSYIGSRGSATTSATRPSRSTLVVQLEITGAEFNMPGGDGASLLTRDVGLQRGCSGRFQFSTPQLRGPDRPGPLCPAWRTSRRPRAELHSLPASPGRCRPEPPTTQFKNPRQSKRHTRGKGAGMDMRGLDDLNDECSQPFARFRVRRASLERPADRNGRKVGLSA